MKSLHKRVLGRVHLLLLLLAFIGTSGCVEALSESTQLGGVPTVTTDSPTYVNFAPITASWTNTMGNTNDWIAIVKAGSPANSGFVALTYTNGAIDGSFTFTNGIAAGNYEIRSYVGGSYQIIATNTLTVTSGTPPGPTATITTNKQTYRRAESITVTWTNTPGNSNDWIALFRPADSSFVALTQTNGQQNGTFTFTGLSTVGDYQARAYRGGTYSVLASTNFSVTSVTTNASTYVPSAPITVNWAYTPGNANDYITINTGGSAPNTGFLRLIMTNGMRNGSTVFAGLPGGSYDVRSYRGGSYEILDQVSINVVGAPPSFTTSKSSYLANESIVVNWTSQPGRQQDWIALVPAGSPANSGFLQTSYVNGEVNGTRTFPGLPAGSYEARYMQEGSYTIVATASFTVTATTGGSCTVPTNPPVVSGTTSGDLTISSTQMSNSVALSVPFGSSILFTSTRENEPSPNYGGVMCQLQDADATAMTPAGLYCYRNAMGTDTGSGTIVVHYSIVTFSSGVTVQRGQANTGFNNPSTITLSAVNPSQSFVLLNGIAVGGSAWGNNEFVRANLVNGTTLDVRTNVAGTRVSWQVVEMSGASVQRGTVSMGSGATSASATVNATPTGTFVLGSYTTGNSSGIAAGALAVATSMGNSSTVLFQRSRTGTPIDISYEVVSWPFATTSGASNFSTGQSAINVTVPGINGTTAVAITGSQAILGQSTGSTTYNGSQSDLVGEAAVTLSTTSNALLLRRSTSQASASIPWTVLDFAHNCNGQ